MKAQMILKKIDWLPCDDEDTDNFYAAASLDDSVNNDMISSGEEAFMLGYMAA
jgi:hypothetical protein